MDRHTLRRTTALAVTGLFTLASLALSSGTAAASRLPADPLTLVGGPAPLSRLVIDAQATNVWATLRDLHAA